MNHERKEIISYRVLPTLCLIGARPGPLQPWTSRCGGASCRLVQLCSETDPAHRARLQKQFVEEEDRLGASAALLNNLDREIDMAIILVARQTALVVAMERHGRGNVKQARTLLYCLIDGQNLHERYRQQVLAAIEENRLL